MVKNAEASRVFLLATTPSTKHTVTKLEIAEFHQISLSQAVVNCVNATDSAYIQLSANEQYIYLQYITYDGDYYDHSLISIKADMPAD